MTVHFHLGGLPVTLSITTGADPARELAEKTDALLDLAMRLPVEGARARYVLRRWARRGAR